MVIVIGEEIGNRERPGETAGFIEWNRQGAVPGAYLENPILPGVPLDQEINQGFSILLPTN